MESEERRKKSVGQWDISSKLWQFVGQWWSFVGYCRTKKEDFFRSLTLSDGFGTPKNDLNWCIYNISRRETRVQQTDEKTLGQWDTWDSGTRGTVGTVIVRNGSSSDWVLSCIRMYVIISAKAVCFNTILLF